MTRNSLRITQAKHHNDQGTSPTTQYQRGSGSISWS